MGRIVLDEKTYSIACFLPRKRICVNDRKKMHIAYREKKNDEKMNEKQAINLHLEGTKLLKQRTKKMKKKKMKTKAL